MRFTQLRLENWRNFTLVDVALQQRAFLLGPNASGKSNLLDVFRFLHDVVAVGGGLQAAVQRRGGVSSLRALAARRNPAIAVKVAIGDTGQTDTWEYEIRFTQDKRGRPTIEKEVVRKGHDLLLSRPDERDLSDRERLTQTFLEQVNANKDFRAVADFFESIRYLHVVPQLIRDPDRSVGRSNDPFGGDLLEQVARTHERTRTARLRRIRDALRIAVPQLKELELTRDDRGIPHLRGKYEHWRPQGAWQTEDQFSDGTLRLLGLLWAVLDGSGPLLLEEPELSLHPEIVRYLPAMLWRELRKSSRQVMISTHSPYLLSDEGIGLDEVLLLQPGKEGTEIRAAVTFTEIQALVDGGIPLPEAIAPRTAPSEAHRIVQFGT